MASFWEALRVESGGPYLDDMQTYVSQPNEPGRRPAVIVVQEAFGLNKNIQDIADRFAAEGFFAVAPAFFHREGTTEGIRGTNPVFGYNEIDKVMPVMGNLRDDQVVLDIDTTIAWLRRNPRVLGDRIGITGFCMGGRVTYLAAAACPGIGAASVYYGGNIMATWGDPSTPFDRTANIQCPVMGNFGDLDANPTVADVGKIEVELKKHGKVTDFKMYPGADHGFMCDDRDSYNEAAAKDSWTRTVAWFQKHLSTVTATA